MDKLPATVDEVVAYIKEQKRLRKEKLAVKKNELSPERIEWLSKLKPCPFCGDKDLIFFNNMGECDYIGCESCGASGGICDGEQDAIETWNKRA